MLLGCGFRGIWNVAVDPLEDVIFPRRKVHVLKESWQDRFQVCRLKVSCRYKLNEVGNALHKIKKNDSIHTQNSNQNKEEIRSK